MEMIKQFYEEEDGMGLEESVMIIAALMCIALLFRRQITQFAQNIMTTVFDQSVVEKPQ